MILKTAPTPDSVSTDNSLVAKFTRMFGGRRDVQLDEEAHPGTRCLLHHRDHAPVLARYDGRQEIPFTEQSFRQFSLLVPTPEFGSSFTSCLGPSLVASGYYRATPA